MVETRSKKRKRQRLMSISSNVSSWPHVPARFESLNDDTLTTVLGFVGKKSYRSFGGLNYHCREIYLNTDGMKKETFLFGYAPLAVITDKIERATEDDDREVFESVGKGVVLYNRRDVLDWALQEQEAYLLYKICNVAGEEGRIDLLEEVWNNIDDDDDKIFIFGAVDKSAAAGGRLDVLKWIEMKWLETKGFTINKENCAFEAARHAQLHILKWLQEEKGLKLDGVVYAFAIKGGHLHVMKWLREQEVDWGRLTFIHAAWKGNLEVLQWLHDEGCPWYEDSFPVREDDIDVTPEVIEWLRVNGYGDRIV